MSRDASWSAQELSTVIGAIYDCAIKPGLWNEALRGIAGSLDYGKRI